MAKKQTDPWQVVAGRNPVREALEAGARIEKIFLLNGMDRRVAAELRSLAKEAAVPVQQVPAQRLERLAPGVNHQGVAALVAEIDYVDVDDMLRDIAPDLDAVRALKPMVLMLDGVQDSHNLGAILRSAVAAGAAGIIIPMTGAAGVNAVVLKTSAGTASRIPISRVDNLVRTIQMLKERGYWIVGADGESEDTVWSQDWDRPIVIVMGSESDGMRRTVAEACDYRVRIPMRGPVESLNVSVAAGILLFAAARGRD